MTRNEFFENYKHPRWQEKRLRIMERDAFTCQRCFATDKTLHVHHGYYEKNKKPWEYADETLHTFCEDCHPIVESNLRDLRCYAATLSPWFLFQLLGYALGLRILENPDEWDAIRPAAEAHWELRNGIADALGLQGKGIFVDDATGFRC